MNTAVNISQQNLEISKMFSTFAVPRNVKDVESTRYISNRLDKAGFLSDNSTSVVLRFLAETEWRLASFVHTYHKFLVRTMPRNDKNLNSKTALGASCSTANTRKRVTSIPARWVQSPYYQISMQLVASYDEPGGRTRFCTVIHTDIYQSPNETEAVGLAVSTVRKKYGAYHTIDLDTVQITQRYNIPTL